MRCILSFLLTALYFCMEPVPARAQLAVRTSDETGFSLHFERRPIAHSDDASAEGTSMALIAQDPWLAYAIGYSLFQRDWTPADGVFSTDSKGYLQGLTNSCAMCHNLPARTPGYGGNVIDGGGHGRNVPHLFGVGLMEMTGMHIRRQILDRYDLNHNGFIDSPDETTGERVIVEAVPGVAVDFGLLEVVDGFPQLNPTLRPVYVDKTGQALSGRVSLLGKDVSGFDIMVNVLGSTVGDHHLPTLRSFVIGVFQSVMGMPVLDGTVGAARMDASKCVPGAWGDTSLCGARQPHFPISALEHPPAKAVSEGELDLLEFYLLNVPPPAEGRQDTRTHRGRGLMRQMQCISCHVESWQLPAQDAAKGAEGDRRFFDFAASADDSGGFGGRMRMLVKEGRQPDGRTLLWPARDAHLVAGVYSDFLQHNVGERFFEYFESNGKTLVHKMFRTPPLWGVGSTAPYGHDGLSPDLDSVIRRHGGEADQSRARYAAATQEDQECVLAFLESLTLYQPDQVPCDLDGDGRSAARLQVEGCELGPEVFRPELLFRRRPRYAGWMEVADGAEAWFSYKLLNAKDIYSLIPVSGELPWWLKNSRK